MKKTFIKPNAKKYEINTKENIVSSIKFDDGSLTVQFHTIYENGDGGDTPWTEEQGCYKILNNEFTIPGSYTTQNYGDKNYTITSVMASFDTFFAWYQDVKLSDSRITSCHD